jgi:flagellar biosynthetic protein FliO
MTWLLVKTLLSLFAVLGLMIAVAWAVKKYILDGRMRGSNMVEIDVLGQRMLQPKRSIFVVKVLNKILVVGTTETGMNTLSEIDDDDVLQQVTVARLQDEIRFEGLTRRSEKEMPAPQTFADYLAQNLGMTKTKIHRRKGGMGLFGRGEKR